MLSNILSISIATLISLFTFITQILEESDERFGDEGVTEIVELVKKTLPLPLNMKKEEITKGDEETATLKNEKGNKIRQDQNEDGEEMDTS